MSARVLNPMMMSEIGHRSVNPSRAALARVRRDLFGPVDHAAARDLAERELRAQSMIAAERWGFDFDLGLPRNNNSRYDWEAVGSHDIVPEPYALRGMPYLSKNSVGNSRNAEDTNSCEFIVRSTVTSTGSTTTTRKRVSMTITSHGKISPIGNNGPRKSTERTPPQDNRVPDNGETSITTSSNSSDDDDNVDYTCGRKKIKCIAREPTTPVLPPSARKQSSITDFLKSRKRTLNGSAKSIVELPEKIARNAGHIRS